MIVMTRWFLWLIIYSFLGWVYESIVCSIGQRKLVNRGFLNGPVCPVYGFGAIISIAVLYEQTENIFLLFAAGMVLTCTLEYITSFLLEKLFNAKWWDYSNSRFNINGRICLLGAVVFGTLSVLLVKYIHPFVEELVEQIPNSILIALSSVILVVITIDIYVTVRHILSLNGRLQEIQTAINRYMDQQTKRIGGIKNSILYKFEESEFYNERIKSLININRIQNKRLAKAFPKLRSIKYEDAWEKLKGFLFSNKLH